MTEQQCAYLAQLKPLYMSGKLTSAALADNVGLSRRSAQRYLHTVPSTHRPAWNRLPESVVECIKAVNTEHPEYNCQWIAELASDQLECSVSRSSVYRILARDRALPKSSPKRMVRSRFEAEYSGDLVQMDTTWGYWWRGQRLCLILLLDDHSRYILHAELTESDTAAANMRIIKETVTRYGAFRVLYTDNASFFKPIRHGDGVSRKYFKESYESAITVACREMGILHLTHKPFEPQAKGKIERIFRFIQERFVSTITDDMSLAEINDAFSKWSTWYNEYHVNRTTRCVPKKRFDPCKFQPLSGEKHLDDIFCWKYTRKVDSCNQFSFEGVVYSIPKEYCMVAFKVTLHVTPHTKIRVWHSDHFICELLIPVH
jgi:putative transposase